MSRFLDNELFVLFLIIAVFLCIMGIAVLLDKRRRKALIALAGRYGLSHEDSDPTLLDQSFTSFPLFDQGYSRDYTNIMKGNIDNLPVVLFDYKYTVGGGKSSSTYRQTVACYRLEESSLPKFDLSPENVVHKIASMFGYQDIDFSSHEGFSKSYLLRGPEETPIRSLFSHETLSYLESHTGWSVEGGGEWVAVFKPNRRITTENFRNFLDDTRGIAGRFKRR